MSSGDEEEVEFEDWSTSGCNPLFDAAQLCADEFSLALMSICNNLFRYSQAFSVRTQWRIQGGGVMGFPFSGQIAI